MEFTEILAKDGSIFVSYCDAPEDEQLESVPTVWHKIVEVSNMPLSSPRNAV